MKKTINVIKVHKLLGSGKELHIVETYDIGKYYSFKSNNEFLNRIKRQEYRIDTIYIYGKFEEIIIEGAEEYFVFSNVKYRFHGDKKTKSIKTIKVQYKEIRGIKITDPP